MTATEPGSDYQLFERLVLIADKADAPEWHFGKYVHPSKSRKELRRSTEGRMFLLDSPVPDNGWHHEKSSDIAPFVAWDGEGITYEKGMPQSYVLFGASTGHYVQSEALTTEDCLETILRCERDNPTAIHVGFAFKYDSEMILRDLTLRHWHVIKKRGSVKWNGYRITYHPGRLFRVSRREGKRRITATIYDVWGFFQSSFVKALRTWLDDSELTDIAAVEAGKDARGEFTYDAVDSFIAPYWRTELRLLVVLADRLRERLLSAGIAPSQWHGAGAVATTIYRQHRTREHQARTEIDRHSKDADITTTLPKEVNEVSRYAYAGGRFELFRLGHTDRTVYQYDINSAYPNAISKLPSLQDAEWEYQVSPKAFDSEVFGLWHIVYSHWSDSAMYQPGPLPYRDSTGRVAFPHYVDGWYWTPEAALVAKRSDTVIAEAWVCHHNGEFPFTWVREMYDERKRRKASGDPSEKAYKLGLNSLYGKMAQRLGYEFGGPLPRFHQLEWAGWVTSFTRMQLFAAMRQASSDLIAVETDAVFSLRPLDLDTGSGLGQWELTEHDWMTYLQSGTYWSNHGAKYRGFDKDSLSHDQAMQWLRNSDWSQPLIGTTTRFVGAGTGLGTPLHRCWVRDSRDMRPGKSGKRLHVAEICLDCASGISPSEELHSLVCLTTGGRSHPHSLPWLDAGVAMELQELQEIEGWDHFE